MNVFLILFLFLMLQPCSPTVTDSDFKNVIEYLFTKVQMPKNWMNYVHQSLMSCLHRPDFQQNIKSAWFALTRKCISMDKKLFYQQR